MTILHQRLEALIPAWREDVRTLAKGHGDVKLMDATIGKAIGGMRGLKALVCDTSYLDPMEGIRFRGMTIPETRAALPTPADGGEAYPSGLWYVLLTGEVPTAEQVDALEAMLAEASRTVPDHVWATINALPKDAHPMTQFVAAITAMQTGSQFAKRYDEGMAKEDYWKPMLDDAITLLGRLPRVAAYIYRRSFKGDTTPPTPSPDLDWGSNFAYMMGVEDTQYRNLMRLYMIIHSDHEGGNVSAHTSHLVGSALSDVYYSLAAGICGLAGPLHGLANQECLKWVMDLMEHFGGTPTKEQITEYAWETLNSGRVIPGYGHAVLRQTDPRYTAQREYALEHCPDDPVVKTVARLYETIPDILREQGKAKNPWPNVDAHSGALQQHYGVTETTFYTVLFGVSRAMGITAQLVWDRAVGMSLERPKSLTIAMLKDAAGIG